MILVKIEPDSIFASYRLDNERGEHLLHQLLALAYNNEDVKEGQMTLAIGELPNGFSLVVNSLIDSSDVTLFVLSKHIEEIDAHMQAAESGDAERIKSTVLSATARLTAERAVAATRSVAKLANVFDVNEGTAVLDLVDGDTKASERVYVAKLTDAAAVLKATFHPIMITETPAQIQ